MLIRWLCSFPASARFPLVGSVNLRSSPASGNAPLGNEATREPTGCVLSKVGQSRSFRWSCCHWIGQGMHPTPSRRSESELLVLHFHRRPRPEFQDTVGKTCRTTKSKDKGKRPPPEENRPRGQPPDHQARRRSRKESHPFPSGAKRKGESYWPARRKNAVDEDSQESPTAKTCSSY